jgi:hypothetical protein
MICAGKQTYVRWLGRVRLQRRQHRWIAPRLFRFQPLAFNDCPGADQESGHFDLPSMVTGGRIAPAMDRPPERCRVVFFISEVHIRGGDQPRRQSILAQQRRPMKRGLSEQPAQFRSCSGLQQSEAYSFRSEARRSDERCIAFSTSLEIEVCSSPDERFHERQFVTLLQPALERHVRNIVQRMRENAIFDSLLN